MLKVSTPAERIRQWLDDNGKKQVDLINLCKPYEKQYNTQIKSNEMTQILQNRSTPKMDKITVMSLAMGVNPMWLYGYDVPMIEIKEGSPRQKLIKLVGDLTDEEADSLLQLIKTIKK